MKVAELAEKLGLEIIGGKQGLEQEIRGGYTSDLLSDVMGKARNGMVWITLQTHKNVMAIASLKELSAIVLVNGARPEADMLAQSHSEGIPVLGTNEPTFEITGRIYTLLKG